MSDTISSALRGRRLPPWLTTAVLGIVVGAVALSLGAYDFKWSAFGLVGLIAGIIIVLVPNRTTVLTGIFVLAMQADVYLRPLYGRAGTAGLEVPLCVLAGALLYAQLRFATRRRVVYRGELTLWIIAILATTAVSVVFSEERFAGVARLLFELELVFVYILGLNIVLMDHGLQRLVRLLAITLMLQTAVFFVQSRLGINFSLVGDVSQLGEIPRPGGTVSANPAGFASYIMPIIMILAARFASIRTGGHRRRLEGMAVAFGVIAIIMTYTRAAWVGLVLGLACITVIGVRRRYITVKQLGIVAVVIVLATIACLPMINARLQEAPLGASYDERAALNRMALLVISAHPLFGVGPGSYVFAYKSYLTSDFSNAWLYTVHNEYLLRAAETGVAGGVVFVIFLLKALAQGRRVSANGDWEQQTFGLGLTAGLVALCWQMYWVPWRGFTYNAMLWLLLGATEGIARLQRLEARDATAAGAENLQYGLDAQQRRAG